MLKQIADLCENQPKDLLLRMRREVPRQNPMLTVAACQEWLDANARREPPKMLPEPEWVEPTSEERKEMNRKAAALKAELGRTMEAMRRNGKITGERLKPIQVDSEPRRMEALKNLQELQRQEGRG